MHKLKKATTALRAYLGRDVHGIELLGDVETVANGLRKEVAALNERCRDAEQRATASVSALRRTELECKSLRDSAKASEDRISQRDREIELLHEECKALRDSLDPDRTGHADDLHPNHHSLRDMLKSLQREFKVAPLISSSIVARRAWHREPDGTYHSQKHPSKDDRYYFYDLQEIVRDLSYDQLAILGRFVATLCLFNIPVGVISKWTVGKSGISQDIKDSLSNRMLNWWGASNIDWSTSPPAPVWKEEPSYKSIGNSH